MKIILFTPYLHILITNETRRPFLTDLKTRKEAVYLPGSRFADAAAQNCRLILFYLSSGILSL